MPPMVCRAMPASDANSCWLNPRRVRVALMLLFNCGDSDILLDFPEFAFQAGISNTKSELLSCLYVFLSRDNTSSFYSITILLYEPGRATAFETRFYTDRAARCYRDHR